ncbi:MAG: transposase [Clostridia bacterium]|nr:transposase [Clostridia bacterium]
MENKRPVRKPTRLKSFDYAKPNVFFITVCTQNRRCILSSVVGEGSPLPQLSVYGKIVDRWIQILPKHYNNVSVSHYVIMPNHIHLLLSVTERGRGDPSPTIDKIIGWFKYQITRDINNIRKTEKEKIFQRSFYDHIVRNRDDYLEIAKYITENPRRWQLDKLYSQE